ncbi:hypothetical protein ACOSQ2_018917 [Xanthoceras sorbifolium]
MATGRRRSTGRRRPHCHWKNEELKKKSYFLKNLKLPKRCRFGGLSFLKNKTESASKTTSFWTLSSVRARGIPFDAVTSPNLPPSRPRLPLKRLNLRFTPKLGGGNPSPSASPVIKRRLNLHSATLVKSKINERGK